MARYGNGPEFGWMIKLVVVLAVLIVWSILVNAPLEEVANPNRTPNPAKAPWYFVGLQELLVYFDPWIAGVLLPGIIIFGLMAIHFLHPLRFLRCFRRRR